MLRHNVFLKKFRDKYPIKEGTLGKFFPCLISQYIACYSKIGRHICSPTNIDSYMHFQKGLAQKNRSQKSLITHHSSDSSRRDQPFPQEKSHTSAASNIIRSMLLCGYLHSNRRISLLTSLRHTHEILCARCFLMSY